MRKSNAISAFFTIGLLVASTQAISADDIVDAHANHTHTALSAGSATTSTATPSLYTLYNFVTKKKEVVNIKTATAEDFSQYVPQIDELTTEYWRLVKEDGISPDAAVYKVSKLMLDVIKNQDEAAK
jgi:L-serine deaminase